MAFVSKLLFLAVFSFSSLLASHLENLIEDDNIKKESLYSQEEKEFLNGLAVEFIHDLSLI